jgi:membrane fusion protein, multidrug efflux system
LLARLSDSTIALPGIRNSKNSPSFATFRDDKLIAMEDFDIVRHSRSPGAIAVRNNASTLSFRGPARAALVFALSLAIWLIPRLAPASDVLEQKFDGVVVPSLWVQVAPQIHGVISRTLFKPGQSVSKGDVLFEIDPGDFSIDVRMAQAELDESSAHLKMAEDAAGRQKKLLAENSTAMQAAQQSITDVEIARAIDARKQAALAKAQLALARTHVTAPISGVVGRPLVAPGAVVEPTTGTVLAEIAQLDPILVSFYVPFNEREQALDKAGTSNAVELFKRVTLSLELPSGRIYEHSGKAEFQGSEIDKSTGMLTVWGKFPNPDQVLLPGLKVRVISRLSY